MISFASSIWLWALAGIAIPLLIHLWNVRKGRTKKIGSIILFTETAVSRARSLRFSDLFLLMVRCLLFLMLAVFVAQPFLSSHPTSNQKGWLLIERSHAGSLYQVYGKEIDSLLGKNFELHEFGGDFELMKLADTTREKKGSDREYWDLLRKLDKIVPAGIPVYIYSGNQLMRFTGDRPAVSLDLQWKTSATNDTTSWIESAYVDNTDSIVVVTGRATGERTSFSHVVLPKNAGRGWSDKPEIDYEGKTAAVDTTSITIGIYAEPGTNDGRYLSGAIEAVRESSRRKIKRIPVKSGEAPRGLDWLFWLSPKTLPEQIEANNTFTYGSGQTKKVHTSFAIDAGGSLIPVYQILDSADVDGLKAWRTGTGETMMTVDVRANRYMFYSRFDPVWNDWVWQEDFPQFVLELLYPRLHPAKIDNRIIDPLQLMPVISKKGITKAALVTKDVSQWFWFIAFGLFLLERSIVYWRQKKLNG